MKKVDTIDSIRAFCKAKHGDCLSDIYVNKRTKLLFLCDKGHTWKATWGSIKHSNSWCLICSGKQRGSIQEINTYASSKGGTVLSTEYINCEQPLKFQCSYGHIWTSTWGLMKNNHSWCPHCYGNIKCNIATLREFALQKHGLLLSTEYKTNHTKMEWQCSNGHIWKATWASIKHAKSWCPTCQSFKTEVLCKTILEQKLHIVFTKTRFYYNNKRYEFDGYNDEHKIAFEYHGIQHYVYPNHWHKNELEFNMAKQRDIDKQQYCTNMGIKLLIIPYIYNSSIDTYINTLLI